MTAPTIAPWPGRVLRNAAALAAGALPVLAARWVLGRSGRVLGWVIVAAIAAGLLYPVVERLARGIRKGPAVAVTGLVIAAALGTLLAVAGREIANDYEHLRDVAPEAATRLEHDERVGPALTEFRLTRNVERYLDELPERLVGGSGAEAIRAAATRGIAAFVTLVLTLFLVAYGPGFVQGMLRRVRDDERRRQFGVRLDNAYRRWVVYLWLMLAKAAALSALTYLICRMAGLPAPMVLSVAVGASSLLPTLGVVVGSVPAVLLALGAHPNGATLIVALILVGGGQALDWLVTHHVIEVRSVRAGTAITLVSFLAGLWLFGLGGGLIGVVAAVAAVALLDELPRPERSSPLDSQPAPSVVS
jgi:putative heme transporter